MIACVCIDGCVVCEVDGLPMDPQRFAERQAMDKESRLAFDRLQEAPRRPTSAAVVHPALMTSRERGAARRARLAAQAAAETFTAGMGWVHTTGLSDRRDSSTANRMRTGRALGRVKKQRSALQDV